MLNERDVENELVASAKTAGAMCVKFTAPARRAVPDRVCSHPSTGVFMIELKAPGKRPTVAQRHEHHLWEEHGCPVYVIDTPIQATLFWMQVERERRPPRIGQFGRVGPRVKATAEETS